jgi:hypothetical protein
MFKFSRFYILRWASLLSRRHERKKSNQRSLANSYFEPEMSEGLEYHWKRSKITRFAEKEGLIASESKLVEHMIDPQRKILRDSSDLARPFEE